MRAAMTIILSLILITVLLSIGYIAYVAITIKHNKDAIAHQGKMITVTTFNFDYAGLNQEQDFFVDGGEEVSFQQRTADTA